MTTPKDPVHTEIGTAKIQHARAVLLDLLDYKRPTDGMSLFQGIPKETIALLNDLPERLIVERDKFLYVRYTQGKPSLAKKRAKKAAKQNEQAKRELARVREDYQDLIRRFPHLITDESLIFLHPEHKDLS